MREKPSAVEGEVWMAVFVGAATNKPTMPHRLVELTGRSRKAVMLAIDKLIERGMVERTYERGPIVPKATLAGIPIRTQLVMGTPSPVVHNAEEDLTDEQRTQLDEIMAKLASFNTET